MGKYRYVILRLPYKSPSSISLFDLDQVSSVLDHVVVQDLSVSHNSLSD